MEARTIERDCCSSSTISRRKIINQVVLIYCKRRLVNNNNNNLSSCFYKILTSASFYIFPFELENREEKCTIQLLCLW